MDKIFFMDKDIEWTDLGGGIKRKLCAYSDLLMVCRLHFNKGSEGSIHSHPHSQATFIISGKFKAICDNKEDILTSGDSVYNESNIPHGLSCLEEGEILDIFTPMREDFLNKQA